MLRVVVVVVVADDVVDVAAVVLVAKARVFGVTNALLALKKQHNAAAIFIFIFQTMFLSILWSGVNATTTYYY